MSEHKFLSDGRKVAIVGQLNNSEWIVQEIFVTDKGDEIPSGERFTTKSLHDAPLESYQKREERRLIAITEEAALRLKKIRKQIEEANNKLEVKAALLANSPDLQSLAPEKTKIFAMFMTGTIKYLVVEGYSIEKPVKFEDFIMQRCAPCDGRFEGIKLASFLGKSDGNIEYRINEYKDGSGCSRKVWPFETYEDAVEKIKELVVEKLEARRFTSDHWKVCQELGIVFPKEILEQIYASLAAGINDSLRDLRKSIADRQESVKNKERELEMLNRELGKQ